jgi:hypothetical protein
VPEAQSSPQAQRKWTPPRDEANERIEIDLDEKDPSKAVSRVRESNEDALSLSGEDGDSQESPDDKRRNQRMSREIQRRTRSVAKNITRQYDQKIAEIQAVHQREIAALNGRVSGLNIDRADTSDAAHETEMAALQTQLELANEKGDSKEAARLQAVIARKEGQYWAMKAGKVSTLQARAQPLQQERREAAETAENPRLTKEAKKWIRANSDWWDDPDYRVEVQGALVIDEEVEEDGFDRATPEYFEEVSKRLHAKFPTLEIAGLPANKNGSGNNGNGKGRDAQDDVEDEDRDFTPANRRAPVMSHEDRGAPPARQRTRRASLSKEQIATMRAMKMDPDNNEDVMTFWEESQALAGEEQD